MAAYGVSAVLFYHWIKKKLSRKNIGFWTAGMFALAGPLIFYSYNHIMFVNYMPFLCLALIGTESSPENTTKGMIVWGITFMIITSFYCSIEGLLTLVSYGGGTYTASTEKLTCNGSWK